MLLFQKTAREKWSPMLTELFNTYANQGLKLDNIFSMQRTESAVKLQPKGKALDQKSQTNTRLKPSLRTHRR